jgi:hypothetical protein
MADGGQVYPTMPSNYTYSNSPQMHRDGFYQPNSASYNTYVGNERRIRQQDAGTHQRRRRTRCDRSDCNFQMRRECTDPVPVRTTQWARRTDRSHPTSVELCEERNAAAHRSCFPSATRASYAVVASESHSACFNSLMSAQIFFVPLSDIMSGVVMWMWKKPDCAIRLSGANGKRGGRNEETEGGQCVWLTPPVAPTYFVDTAIHGSGKSASSIVFFPSVCVDRIALRHADRS